MDANLAQVIHRLTESYRQTAKIETQALLKELGVAQHTMIKHMDRNDTETRKSFEAIMKIVENQASMSSKDLRESLRQIAPLREFASKRFGEDDKLVEVIDQVIKRTQSRSSFKASITQKVTEEAVEAIEKSGISIEDAAKAQNQSTKETSTLNKVLTKFVGIMAKRDLIRVSQAFDAATAIDRQATPFAGAVAWSKGKNAREIARGGKTEEGKVFVNILKLLREQGTLAKKDYDERRALRVKENQQRSEVPGEERPQREQRRPRGQRERVPRDGPALRSGKQAFGAGIAFGLLRLVDDFIRLIVFPIALILGAVVAGWIARGGGGILDGLKKAYKVLMEDVLPKISSFFTDTVVPMAEKIYDFFKTSVVPVLEKIWTDFLVPFGKFLGEIAAVTGSKILEGLTNIGPKLQDFFNNVLIPLWNDVLSPLVDSIKKGLEVLAPIVRRIAEANMTLVFSEFGAAIDLLSTWLGGIAKAGKAIADMIQNGITGDKLTELFQGVAQSMTALPEFLIKTAMNITAWFMKAFGFDENAEALKNFAASFNLYNFITSSLSAMGEWLKGVYTKVVESVKSAIQSVVSGSLFTDLAAYMTNMFSFTALKDKLDKIMEEYNPVTIIGNMFTQLGDWMKRIFTIDWTSLIRDRLPSVLSNAIFGATGTAEPPPRAPDSPVPPARQERAVPPMARFNSPAQRGQVAAAADTHREEVARAQADRDRRRAASTQGMGAGSTTVNNVSNNQQSTIMPVAPRNNDRSLTARTDQNVNF